MHYTKSKITFPIFVFTIFTSAFLLFAIQPMFTKMILPQLGGSPAVWSVAMVFFQAILLSGYLYAHILTKYLSTKKSAYVHSAIMLFAMLFLPISVSTLFGVAPEEGQAAWLIGIFFVSVGLPFFAIAGNGPLLQAWFTRSGHRHATDPYFLYGASNLGSFTALLLFPILFEPLLLVKTQSFVWSLGFLLLTGLIILSAFTAYNSNSHKSLEDTQNPTSKPDWKMTLNWIGLSFIPSGLLVAVTAHITTDIAAAPFLWILPLALFLLTFVLVFRKKPLFPASLFERIFPALACSVLALQFVNIGHFLIQISFHLCFFFIAALIFHNRLYNSRPDAKYLTHFYLWISFGGVLGGLFCGLVAPFVFNRILEYPILVSASVIGLALCSKITKKQFSTQIIPIILIGAAILFFVKSHTPQILQKNDIVIYYTLIFLVILTICLYQKIYIVAAIIPIIFLLHDNVQSIVNERTYERSFFGVHKIDIKQNGQFRTLNHGVTLHGAIKILNADGSPFSGKPEPLTYYHKDGPNAETLRAVPDVKTGRQIGIVGLGSGAHACNGKEMDKFSYFEIDPSVVHIAKNPNLFSFLSICAPNVRIALGDARLTLAKEPKGKFDYLLIDAFSSDAIPTHLLTKEAFELYLGLMKDDGILTMHISNTHLELESVVAALARETRIQAIVKRDINQDIRGLEDRSSSHVVAFSKKSASLAGLLKIGGWSKLQDKGTLAWTDDYSNVFGALWRNYTK
jgi:hypothetical protein